MGLLPRQAANAMRGASMRQNECAVCLETSIDEAEPFGCGHALCVDCAPKVTHCPLCRFPVRRRTAAEAAAPVLTTPTDDECPCCYAETRGRQWRWLQPCGHAVCYACARSSSNCPRCRAPIERQTLAAAAAGGDWASLARYVARGDDPNPSASRVGAAPVHFVAAAGRVAELRLLAAAGARADVVDETGWSPLHWAANNGHLDCVAFLVDDVGAAPDVGDRWGIAPRQWAREAGHDDVAAFLDARCGGRPPEPPRQDSADVAARRARVLQDQRSVRGAADDLSHALRRWRGDEDEETAPPERGAVLVDRLRQTALRGARRRVS